MLCKNCGKYISLNWPECPTCGHLLKGADFENLLAKYYEYLKENDYIKARISLERCINLAKYTSKEKILKIQLDKLNHLIKSKSKIDEDNINADIKLKETSTPDSENRVTETLQNSYVKDLVISRPIDNDSNIKNRQFGRHKYDKPNRKLTFILIFLVVSFIAGIHIHNIFFSVKSEPDKRTLPYVADLSLLNKNVLNDTRVIVISASADDIYIPLVSIIPHNGKVSVNGEFFAGEKILNGKIQDFSTDTQSSCFIKIDKSVCYVLPNTKLQFRNESSSQERKSFNIKVNSGAVFLNVRKIKNSQEAFRVTTAMMTVGVRGTKFFVNKLQNADNCYCLEGTIEAVNNFDNKSVIIESEYGISKDLSVSTGMPEPQKIQPDIIELMNIYDRKISYINMGLPPADEEKFLQPDGMRGSKQTDLKDANIIESSTEKNEKSSKIVSGSDILNKNPQSNSSTIVDKSSPSSSQNQSEPKNKSEDDNIYKFAGEKYKDKYGASGVNKLNTDLDKLKSKKITEEKAMQKADGFQKNVYDQAGGKFGKSAVSDEIEKLKKK